MEHEIRHLGEFEITSGIMRVTDPCYNKDTWCSGSFVAELGIWEAIVGISDEGQWGKRAAELIVMHESQRDSFDGDWEKTKIDVGVDSGQAGFFDNAKYPDTERTGEYGDMDTFYGQACALTHSEKDRNRVAGVMEFGAVSSSGYGDGGYDCYVRRKNGVVVAAKIVFISDEEIDDEEF